MKSSWIRWDRLDHIVNVLPLLRFLALAGLMICGYLGILKLTGQTTSIVGCGTESGCDNALGSRWSQFFGIPVSVLAGVVYLALLITTWRPSRPLYGAFAICLTGAALWFIGLLYFDIKAVCPWCLAMHTIGIITSLVLILSLHQLPASNPRTPLRFAPLGAVVALLVLLRMEGTTSQRELWVNPTFRERYLGFSEDTWYRGVTQLWQHGKIGRASCRERV